MLAKCLLVMFTLCINSRFFYDLLIYTYHAFAVLCKYWYLRTHIQFLYLVVYLKPLSIKLQNVWCISDCVK